MKMRNDSRIIVGDVHGCFKTFMALLAQLPKDIPITISGDLIDRGPESNKVVQYCIDNNIDVTLGNHEDMAINFVRNNTLKVGETFDHDDFIMNGGKATLLSYGIGTKNTRMWGSALDELVPGAIERFKAHVEYFKTLPVYRKYDIFNDEGRQLIVSHSSAGEILKDGDDLDSHRSKMEMIWGRPRKIQDAKQFYNIFGHTPQESFLAQNSHANVDTGACFKRPEGFNSGYGVLTALQYPELIVYQQDNIE
jgi:serine/threonine protein phosphatase 1